MCLLIFYLAPAAEAGSRRVQDNEKLKQNTLDHLCNFIVTMVLSLSFSLTKQSKQVTIDKSILPNGSMALPITSDII